MRRKWAILNWPGLIDKISFQLITVGKYPKFPSDFRHHPLVKKSTRRGTYHRKHDQVITLAWLHIK